MESGKVFDRIKMPTMYEPDEYAFTCDCGWSVRATKSRFNLMMRLHQKKCAHRYDMKYTLHETINDIATGRLKSKTEKVVLG